MNVMRAICNPLISPGHVTPSAPDLKVVCAFNAAVAEYQDEIILLVRVAETAREVRPDEVAVPILEYTPDGTCIRVERIPRTAPGLDLSDSRVIMHQDRYLLTSLSHLRVARSVDGINFSIEDVPFIFPSEPYEEYGLEDARVTQIGDTYYINYSVVSRMGIAVGLATTKDFKTVTRHGLIFEPDNKNVAIFPEKINGQYMALHRPTSTVVKTMGIWSATSPDLIHWGNHRLVVERRPHSWDAIRIGAGAVPIKIDEGWLEIYHGVDPERGYCLGALLLDHDDPTRVLGRSDEPLLYPHADHERVGFFGNVVFTCGALVKDREAHIYYGAADEHMCLATVLVDEILDHLRPPEAHAWQQRVAKPPYIAA